jgi:hypothetical protein
VRTFNGTEGNWVNEELRIFVFHEIEDKNNMQHA